MNVIRLASAVALLAVAAAFSLSGCFSVTDCRAADVNGYSTTCSGPQGWAWTGTACVFTRACNCTGDDCRSMFTSQELCESAHATCTP
jgi:hypothetical protein